MTTASYVASLFSLEGKTALVTGPGTGIGQGIAVALARSGADIIGTYHHTPLEETKALVEQAGRSFHAVQVDFSDPQTANQAVDAMLQKHTIDILINNAGTIKREQAAHYSEEDWLTVMDVNINSLFFLTQRVGRQMLKNGQGKIVNIASLLSFQGGVFVPAYTASKHAVAGLTKAFANEWANQHIQVNAIAPGYISTNNTQAIRDDENRNEEILKRIPAGRWGKPEDLAGAAVFLSSPASDYMNGHILAVDGGWLAR
ncbi:2-dehydro-3-deoxy-D-gluconate 5-dehydrogenase KduD [Bacillus sp. FSL K6-4563]|uniref:2-dehydro-3-deoxy-D-gluconate 5-dehydrogenase KduD n=1 Tax=Bacillus TaxID=1386 RepID=UPI000D02FBE3|nr:2-dehydro-3-deoxy-D-gluconate 5-dehydrogenase KduD [Bacillus pumilus]PRS11890.1 2-deoxy-D-gluconate 3-dehydrogenase [Bacillus pumilus]PRS34804.1 2-deoxy-D-gluconate 3-dehydrogenase [Bacillus pumilus]PRS64181.1 2-deoxy-D-gluconate 3-dehydrogenase [Bacillus pumilus]PRS68694.1 2-deoxy-D-gluconate 3-dehydrogenase [Bacillus pumilus]